jgi:hypothetical protein
LTNLNTLLRVRVQVNKLLISGFSHFFVWSFSDLPYICIVKFELTTALVID